MNTKTEVPTVAQVRIALEQLSEILKINLEKEGRIWLMENTDDVLAHMEIFGRLANKCLTGKYITPTYFDVDKREIMKVSLIKDLNKKGSSIIPTQYFRIILDKHISDKSGMLIFNFEQINELIQIGTTQEDELDSTQFCYFIVK